MDQMISDQVIYLLLFLSSVNRIRGIQINQMLFLVRFYRNSNYHKVFIEFVFQYIETRLRRLAYLSIYLRLNISLDVSVTIKNEIHPEDPQGRFGFTTS